MKKILLLSLAILIALTSFSQNHKKIQKAWINTAVENLSDRKIDPDTLSFLYHFEKSKLTISFYPGWTTHVLDWSVIGNDLTIGIGNYKIEELTDTSLVIMSPGFRRFRFLSQEYLANQESNLLLAGEYNGKPVYKTSRYITPVYSKSTSLGEAIQKNTKNYHIKKASLLFITFIITEKGTVENIQVVSGITEGFDNEVVKNLAKTSKDWKPAYFKGKPIQTQTYYTIKFLDSLSPFSYDGL